MSADSGVRQLRPEDAEILVALRREALAAEPLAFGAALEEDHNLSLEFVRGSLSKPEEHAIFGHFSGDLLDGMVGVARWSAVKRRHKAILWGMYVARDGRTKGAGRALLRAAIAQVRAWPGVEQLHLSVTEPAAAARSLYESEGFRIWGREPHALGWNGERVDEFHLVLELKRTSDPGPRVAGSEHPTGGRHA